MVIYTTVESLGCLQEQYVEQEINDKTKPTVTVLVDLSINISDDKCAPYKFINPQKLACLKQNSL